MREVNLAILKKQKRKFKTPAGKQQFGIEDYRVMRTDIEVDYYVMDTQAVCSSVFIDREKYEQWLSDTGKLHWESDEEDEYSVRTHEGEMQVEFYWDHADYEDKKKHLTDYLVANSHLINTDHSLQIFGAIS